MALKRITVKVLWGTQSIQSMLERRLGYLNRDSIVVLGYFRIARGTITPRRRKLTILSN